MAEAENSRPYPVTTPERAILLREQELAYSWLIQKKEGTTRRNYKRVFDQLRARFPQVLIRDLSVGHISVFLEEQSHLSLSSKRFARDVVSSLLKFCLKLGYISTNPAAALDPIRVPDRTASRLLTEEQVFRLIDRTKSNRDRLLIKLLYAGGLRVSELCGLKWRDFFLRTDSVQLVVTGKGAKTRSIVLPMSIWNELLELKEDGVKFDPDSPVFISRNKAALDQSQVLRIVKAAAARAKLGANISPHWMRHAHATHALERGAPIHLVQRTLGHASISTTGKYLNANPAESSTKYLGI